MKNKNLNIILGIVLGCFIGVFISKSTHSCNDSSACQIYKDGQVDIRISAENANTSTRYILALGLPKTKNEKLLYSYIIENKNHDFFDRAYDNKEWPFGKKVQIGNDY